MATNGALTDARALDFRVLGPLEVRDGTQPVVLRGRKQRALLAVLLLHAGEWVSSDLLVDALWGEDAPRTARAALQNYVAQLRRTLGAEVIIFRDGGYELQVSREQIDLGRFEHLVTVARTDAGEERVEKLREALALWRGPPLADVAYEPFASPEAVRLDELRVSALEELIDAELAQGAGLEFVEKLEALVVENPFRERFPAQLMLALYRAGRQAEALDVYRQTRRRLLDELGIEPGTALRELEQAILRHDDSLEPVAPPGEKDLPVEERRKLVTVLLADVACAEPVDPELLRETSARALQRIRAALERHGAQIEQRASDEVMAVFGVPQAHEDDAVRAARAALEIQADIGSSGEPPDVRVGVETGEVLAGVDAAGHGFVSGAVVTQAKRLLEHARPGEALVGETALSLVGDTADTKVGRTAREAALVRLVDSAVPTTGRFREPPLAGRREELRALQDAFAGVVESREARLFLLVGEAGIGKTRLARELTVQLEGRATIARGRCLSYGDGLTYWPLVEALRTLGEPAAQALELLTAGGATSASQLAWSVRQALEAVARERPLLIVVEDLHWAEDALLDLLESVAEFSEDAPVLLLCLARPELLDRRPGWRESVSRLPLEPLARADCESLLANLEPPPEAKARVLEVGGGNPLFLEELSAFVAEGGNERQLPPRIHVLLQARLDALPEPERLVLTTAALEGMVFHRGALTALLPEERRSELPGQLAALTRALLIRPAENEIEGEEAFRFRHQLIRDTAYAAIRKGERARLHERFAAWLEQHTDRRTELTDIGAYHLEQAALAKRDLSSPDAALEARAASALADAGERARLRTDLRAAAGLWRRALHLLDDDNPLVPKLELELAVVLGYRGEFEQASALLERAGQRATDPAVQAAIRLARLRGRMLYAPEGVPAEIRRECRTTIPLYDQRGDHRELARAWLSLAIAEYMEVQAEAAADAWAKAAEHAHLAGDRALEALVLGYRAVILAETRTPAARMLGEVEELAARFPGEPAIETARTWLRAVIAYDDGRRDEGRALAHETIETLRRTGFAPFAASFTAGMGDLELLADNVEEAKRLVLAAIDELQGLDERGFLSGAYTSLAHIRIAQDRYREAVEIADEAEKIAATHDRFVLTEASNARARAYAHVGEIQKAKAAAARAVALAEATDALRLQASAKSALAEVLAAAEQWPAALVAAQEAERLYATVERTLERGRAAALAEHIKHQITLST